jgi:hypothetical protein
VDADFQGRLTRANKVIFPRLLKSIDELLGLTGMRRDLTVARECLQHLSGFGPGSGAKVADTATC